MAKLYGPSNPNYGHGRYCAEQNDPMHNLRLRFQLQAKLTELLDMDLTKSKMTPEEFRWVKLVVDERPEWARHILLQRGFKDQ